MRSLTVGTLLITGAIALFPSGAWAQGETTSAIVGQVTDASKRGRAGGQLTITNAETGLTRSVRPMPRDGSTFPS